MTDAIEKFMTRSVHTIGTKSPLTEAHRMMNDHAIRHLPVLEGGRLVGMLSQRDLHLIETLKDVDPKEVLVEEAMSQDAYTVLPEVSLEEVAREMALHKYGSAVIARSREVLGIFTTTDALRALSTVLSTPRKAVARKVSKPAARGTKTKAPTQRTAAKARKGSGQSARRSRR
ncbi:CBS domain-containing protein [Hyalangium rubrum]|uniref:CBS domain-containing protein n=1 Tax=Hyalangium rubrum TaxID=3103134 RepID=A0ABU5H1D6_9BACT|nr:CBS domain-containing protein [Hyalangium sp. s54d21]MDY7227271.1 CBS domain-containing protein [Hyalangium sp. s54d21]